MPLFIVLILVLIVVLSVLLVLFWPVRYWVIISDNKAAFSVRWLFLKYPFERKRRPFKKSLYATKNTKGTKKSTKRKWALRRKDLIVKSFALFFCRVAKALMPRRICAKIRVGLKNPADTGLLLGFLGIINERLCRHMAVEMDCEGDFAEERLEVEANIFGIFILAPLLASAIVLIVKYLIAIRAAE